MSIDITKYNSHSTIDKDHKLVSYRNLFWKKNKCVIDVINKYIENDQIFSKELDI